MTIRCHFFEKNSPISFASINLSAPPRVGEEVRMVNTPSAPNGARRYVHRVVWFLDPLESAHVVHVFIQPDQPVMAVVLP